MLFETFTTHARTCASGLTSARKKSLARPSPSTTPPRPPGNTCNHRKIRTFVPPLSPVPISCQNLRLRRLLHLRGLNLYFLGSPLSHSLASWVANRSCVPSVSHVMLSCPRRHGHRFLHRKLGVCNITAAPNSTRTNTSAPTAIHTGAQTDASDLRSPRGATKI